MTLPVAILAGGLATRLRPLTDEVPKSLVDVAGRPFAEHQLDLLHQHGFNEVVFCVGHLSAQIERALGDGGRFGMRLSYVDDGPELVGTGGALRRALPRLGESFLVMYGDSYLDCDYQAIALAFMSSAKLGLMTVLQNENRWDRSNVRFERGAIQAYDKTTSDPAFKHVDYGLGALRAEALFPYPSDRKLDLAQVYQDLHARDQLAAYEVPERFYEIGSLSGLEEVRAKLATRDVS
ncbi:MAG: nucleotidyltransferase family protein [Vicinamibacterales bacterium]